MLGTCKWFKTDYGFIKPDEGDKDIFLHRRALEDSGIREVKEGDRLSFEVEQGKKGPQAVNVRLER